MFEVLSRNLPGWTEENHKILNQDTIAFQHPVRPLVSVSNAT
jgi:hypothetical protein